MNIAMVVLLPLLMQAPAPPRNAAISGVVTEKGTGRPIAQATISTMVNVTWLGDAVAQSPNTKTVKATTDEGGHYRLGDLPPGDYRIELREPGAFLVGLSKRVTLAGQDLDSLDFAVVVDGSISGKVLDENKEPVPGMTVYLIAKEYFMGTVGYFYKATARTDDRGEYKMARVPAGQSFLLMADRLVQKLPARSETPLNPKLRRKVPMRTWYLNSPDKEGAAPMMLRGGEQREGVNIEVKKSTSYCIEGVLSSVNGPGTMNFSLEGQKPSSGVSTGGGMFSVTPYGSTGNDGRFRICDLTPGPYRLQVTPTRVGSGPAPLDFSATTIAISDRDITGLEIATAPPMDIPGEVVLEGTPPAQPLTAKVNVSFSPMVRTQMPGENPGARAAIPGEFTMTGMHPDDYSWRGFPLSAPGLYVKDVTYAGRSVMYEPMHVGAAIGNGGVRVTVGQDGAVLTVTAQDKDGKIVPDAPVVVMPAGVPSDGVLAARLVKGQTDQSGRFTTLALPPGKYLVAAGGVYDYSEARIHELAVSRARVAEVTLGPNGKESVAVEVSR